MARIRWGKLVLGARDPSIKEGDAPPSIDSGRTIQNMNGYGRDAIIETHKGETTAKFEALHG